MKNKITQNFSWNAILALMFLIPYTCAFAQTQEWINYNHVELSVKSIADDGVCMWMGLESGGVLQIEKITQEQTHYTKYNSGLVSNNIRAIAVDNDGVKWIGTIDRGLVSYDGSNWEVYDTNNSGLPVNDIRTLKIDVQNRIWIGTRNGGLAIYDGLNWIVYDDENSIIPDQQINSIAFEEDTVWLGIWHYGLVRFNHNGWTLFDTSNSELPSVNVNTVAIDSNGVKWIGAWGQGLASFDGHNWNVFNTSNSGLPHNSIGRIVIDPNGIKWLNTQAGLVSFSESEWTVYNMENSGLPSNILGAIAIEEDGTKWIGTRPVGLVSFDGAIWIEHSLVNSISPFSGYVESSHITAHSGLIWVAANMWSGEKQLIEFDGTNWTAYNASDFVLPGDWINSLVIDDNGNKWIASGSGMVSFDGTEWTVYDTSNTPLPSNDIGSVAFEENGTMWVGVPDGLVSYSETNWTLYDSTNSGFPGGSVTSIAAEVNGTIWFGISSWESTRGLYSFDGTTWVTYDSTNSGWPEGGVIDIAFDPLGGIWVSQTRLHLPWSSHKLVHFDGLDWNVYDTYSLGEGAGVSLAIENTGKLWCAEISSSDMGIASFDGVEWIGYSSDNSPLASSEVYSIAIDQHNNKWMAHALGVSVYNESGTIVGIDDNEKAVRNLPSKLMLNQNYPNPFNPTTTISYDLPESSNVELIIYDLKGRLVNRLTSEYQPAGNHRLQWQGVDQQGQPVSTGVYLCKLLAVAPHSGGVQYSKTIKMVYLK